MLGLFRPKPLLDQGTRQWLFDSFGWALTHFDRTLFQQATLIQATDQFFPDHVDSPEQMAQTLLQRVQSYCQMESWPCHPVPMVGQTDQLEAPQISVGKVLRGSDSQIEVEGTGIPIPFDPNLLRTPDILIAHFAQNLANLLGRACQTPPPGGDAYRGPAVDLLAIFMGFGLFLCNNAFSIRRGCSSCAPPSVQMMGDLTEEQMTYALAIFCVLKQIPDKQVEPQLKKTLRGWFHKAYKEVQQQDDEIARLRQV